MKFSILYKVDGSLLTIRECYWWEMALSVGIKASLDNTQEWRETREEAEKIIARNITNHEASAEFSRGFAAIPFTIIDK
jgi:hypothetical protein